MKRTTDILIGEYQHITYELKASVQCQLRSVISTEYMKCPRSVMLLSLNTLP